MNGLKLPEKNLKSSKKQFRIRTKFFAEKNMDSKFRFKLAILFNNEYT